MVEAMDLAVGKVLDKLESLGLDDEVVVAFTSTTAVFRPPRVRRPRTCPCWWKKVGSTKAAYANRSSSVGPGHASRIRLQRARDEHRFLSYLRKGGRRKTQGRRSDRRSRPDAFAQGWKMSRDALYWHYPHYSNQGGFRGAIRMGT